MPAVCSGVGQGQGEYGESESNIRIDQRTERCSRYISIMAGVARDGILG